MVAEGGRERRSYISAVEGHPVPLCSSRNEMSVSQPFPNSPILSPSPPNLVLWDTLCSCEAYGMRSRQQETSLSYAGCKVLMPPPLPTFPHRPLGGPTHPHHSTVGAPHSRLGALVRGVERDKLQLRKCLQTIPGTWNVTHARLGYRKREIWRVGCTGTQQGTQRTGACSPHPRNAQPTLVLVSGGNRVADAEVNGVLTAIPLGGEGGEEVELVRGDGSDEDGLVQGQLVLGQGA